MANATIVNRSNASRFLVKVTDPNWDGHFLFNCNGMVVERPNGGRSAASEASARQTAFRCLTNSTVLADDSNR